MSPSLRGSGLKYSGCCKRAWFDTSPSLRGSGLKFVFLFQQFHSLCVSLFTREWIEIAMKNIQIGNKQSLPLYEGVDWNFIKLDKRIKFNSLPLYEGVDWNCKRPMYGMPFVLVSLFTREWIEIFKVVKRHRPRPSPSLRGSGLKYIVLIPPFALSVVSLFTREWIEIIRQL